MIKLEFLRKYIKTGELHFQFDEDESIPIASITDYQECIMRFKQQKESETTSDITYTNNASIGFTGSLLGGIILLIFPYQSSLSRSPFTYFGQTVTLK